MGMLHCSARPQPLTLLGAVSLAAARFAFVTAAELIEVRSFLSSLSFFVSSAFPRACLCERVSLGCLVFLFFSSLLRSF